MSSSADRTYRDSCIDLDALLSLAARVANETKVKRDTKVSVEEVVRVRPVKKGLFGLGRGREEYTETKRRAITSDFWVLETRFWQRVEKATKHSPEETTRERIDHCLGVDGTLFIRIESSCEVFPIRGGYFEKHEEPVIREMTSADVELLDFASKYESWSSGRFSGASDRERDESRRTAQSKGGGLLQRLNNLLSQS